MRPQRLIALLCLFGSLALIVFLVIQPTTDSETAVREKKLPSQPPLVKEVGVNKLYQLDKQSQGTLVQVVEHFCVKEYHRESCIHHLMTCGSPCFVVIPAKKRPKIFADYNAVRKGLGLSELPLPSASR
jgi:hypothetical protein